MAFTQLNDAAGKLILRVSVGGLMLFHGIHKLFSGVDGIAGLFASKGIPGFLAYGAYLGEVVAPVFLILGFCTRTGALLLGGTMAVAILTAHSGDIFGLNQVGAWAIELQMFYLLGAISIFLLGAGGYSVDAKKGR